MLINHRTGVDSIVGEQTHARFVHRDANAQIHNIIVVKLIVSVVDAAVSVQRAKAGGLASRVTPVHAAKGFPVSPDWL